METYNDKQKLGDGGCADVIRCERSSDGKEFAKKILFSHLGDKLVRRFKQEVRIQQNLVHPNIIPVLDSQLDSPPYWYVMPLYRTSLRDVMNDVIGNDERIDKVFVAVLNAIDYAHSQGVIHRDLKPHNVLLNDFDDVVVTDFGIGKVMDVEGDRFTATGQFMGSSLYASPEQCTDAKNVDHRSDIYNLGRMLYEMHTERLTSSVQSLDRLPKDVAIIVERSTENRISRRYQTVSDLIDAWRSRTQGRTSEANSSELSRILEELSDGPINTNNLKTLDRLLTPDTIDQDLRREVMLKLSVDALAGWNQINPENSGEVIGAFVRDTTSQNWGAAHLDAVTTRCSNLFIASQNARTRADLIYCILFLGIVRKKYAAIENASQLLQVVSRPEDIEAIIAKLSAGNPIIVKELPTWMSTEDLHSRLATFFTTRD
ncbi:Serine/threonine-protein kinase PrkC [Stieleria bergensis]|uniref:Serine/threonine-protein kinase PrkC n=1 Tax=Stieleria bergensis TaxID=2528025 RepID=A0A517T1W0_9BACT|nr:Serine/threonine-protein kinase PrkC [Planctomycetes bacterium SV_7m_r]